LVADLRWKIQEAEGFEWVVASKFLLAEELTILAVGCECSDVPAAWADDRAEG